MTLVPIQVIDENVLIPKSYLHGASEVEVIFADEYIIIKPKRMTGSANTNGVSHPQQPRRYSFIGSGQTRNPKAAIEAEEILKREIDRQSGWSVKQ